MNPFVPVKILHHLPILGQYIAGGAYSPIQVEIDLTNLCTSACHWCAGYQERELHPFILFGTGSNRDDQWDSSRERVLRLINELADYGVKSLTWTGGGDPSLHPHLAEFLKHAASLGLDNGLITNGVIDVTHCIHDCQWVRFSVDAATETGYKQQHGREKHFHRVLSNVREAVARKRRDGLKTTIGVGFVTAPEVIHEIVPFAKLWKHIGIDYIQYRPIMDNYGREYHADNATILQQIRLAEKVDSRVVKSDAKYNAMESGENGMTSRCHGTFLETAIAADGCVYACCHLKSVPQYSLGSLYEETFRAIWERHLAARVFETTLDCVRFCRHFSTNSFIENHVLPECVHENFI